MKVQFVIPMTLLVSFALVGVMRMRRKDQEKDDKRVRFQDIKLKVTNDVLRDYQNEMAEKQHTMEKMQSEQTSLVEQMVVIQTKLDSSKRSANECHGNQKSSQDQLTGTETDLNKLKDEYEKEAGVWKSEIAALQQQLAGQSAICNLLKEAPEAARNMCPNKQGGEAKQNNQEAPKQEAPKKEEAPKQEEAPKKEEVPKQEAPKKEEAPKKDEAPKKEEAPKQEAKAEVPEPKKEALR